jgi:hypothetical protein
MATVFVKTLAGISKETAAGARRSRRIRIARQRRIEAG